MPLYYPPALSVTNFVGSYKSKTDYTDLEDTDTNNAFNCEYDFDRDIKQRNGSLKLYNTALTGSSATARPITGHYYFDKLGVDSGFNIVAAGDGLYNYSTATASLIRTGMTDDSETYWSFIQIQDFRSASDDIVLMSNGVDPIQFWNGSATAVVLNAQTSASQVPICKYMAQIQNKVYAANIVDSTDVDSPATVRVSEIGDDGAPNPHRFPDAFVVGGSDRSGEIQNIHTLNDDLIIFKEKSIWRFRPGLADTNDLDKIIDDIGLHAPRSLISTGNELIFLSERGVYAFDGARVQHLSQRVDDIILRDSNQQQLKLAKAVLDRENNHYILYYPVQGQNRNNRALIFDLKTLSWQPPITGRQVNFISTFLDSNNRSRIIFGDYLGYLFEDRVTGVTNDGVQIGYNDTVGGVTANTITASSVTFPTTNDGLAGLRVTITDGVGVGQENYILSNTSAVLTLENDWGQNPNTASTFTVAGIDSYWQSKDYEFGNHDLVKIFRELRVRLKEQGQMNLDVYYIVDFNGLDQATLRELSMLGTGLTWSVSNWDEARWDGKITTTKKISMRSTNKQTTNGTNLALRFGNKRANETWRIRGFDITIKQIGKR